MSTSSSAGPAVDSPWVRFWHVPVRAERLALLRVLLATVLLADELVQFLPNLAEFFGPGGVAPAGLWDASQLTAWRLSYAFFATDNLVVIYIIFGLWVVVTIGFLVGWRTRWMNVFCWLLTRCFMERNPNIIYGGDDVLQIALFLLLLTPCGAAFSLDAVRMRRQNLDTGHPYVPPWSLRIIQIQMCLIYCSSGLAKLRGENWADGWWTGWPQGTWWEGTSIHYFLNDTTMARRSYAEFPVPFWITKPMTWLTVGWEALFPLLVLHRWTRRVALVFGVLFHVGILLTVDIGWFSFYTLCLYAVWIPDSFWRRFDKPS